MPIPEEVKLDAKYTADKVLRICKGKTFPDGRFRTGTMAGQMQEIVFAYRLSGAKILKEDLIRIWAEKFYLAHKISQLRRLRTQYLRAQMSAAKRIKEINRQLEELEK